MLKYLHLQNVGPAPEMTLRPAPRLNVLTGDNGLGKSFLLDVAWWALTRQWPAEVNPALTSGLPARPLDPGTATIDFSFHAKSKKDATYRSVFDRHAETWTGRPGRPANPGLVLYAQVDGGFSVWDPARNYWRKAPGGDLQERQPAYVFSAREVWNGLKAGEVQLCNGLIADWALWQKEGGTAFEQLSAALHALSPSAEEALVAGKLGRLSVGDARWIPTLRMPYGRDVPVPMASAGMRRIVALAYLLVWAWQEHVRAAELLDEPPTPGDFPDRRDRVASAPTVAAHHRGLAPGSDGQARRKGRGPDHRGDPLSSFARLNRAALQRQDGCLVRSGSRSRGRRRQGGAHPARLRSSR
ncbi:Hypothetical protein CAP_5608 [Chondromyces apiculatus DSM 436]|uniref:Uncharacterized protein n=1 Tax=Chondromyces apiculatus DSM 436 TaxID=1192034 RepID=A0A017T3J5_9BACT|nr:Hypothetical protein CAP_5608 [Chondromyces apiculatus DSM 436]